jgi:hypothetical protein
MQRPGKFRDLNSWSCPKWAATRREACGSKGPRIPVHHDESLGTEVTGEGHLPPTGAFQLQSTQIARSPKRSASFGLETTDAEGSDEMTCMSRSDHSSASPRSVEPPRSTATTRSSLLKRTNALSRSSARASSSDIRKSLSKTQRSRARRGSVQRWTRRRRCDPRCSTVSDNLESPLRFDQNNCAGGR